MIYYYYFSRKETRSNEISCKTITIRKLTNITEHIRICKRFCEVRKIAFVAEDIRMKRKYLPALKIE